MAGSSPLPSFGQNPKEQLLFFGRPSLRCFKPHFFLSLKVRDPRANGGSANSLDWGEDFRFPPPSHESSLPPLQEDSYLPPKSPPTHPCWVPQEDYLPPKRRFLLPTPAWRPILHPTPPPIIRRGPLLPTPSPTHPNSNPIPELIAMLQAAKEEVLEMSAR